MDQIETVEVGEPQPGVPGRAPDTGADTSDPSGTFQRELARAMQSAAERERNRIGRVIADQATEQADATRSRAAIEADELRRLAEEDLARIQEWSAAEADRIRAETERRTAERKGALATYLAQHQAIIDEEIRGLDGAVVEYDGRVGAFFDRLGSLTDPAEIARLAGSLPQPPDFDAARAAARARAIQDVSDVSEVSEVTAVGGAAEGGPYGGVSGSDSSPSVGVMDPEAVGRVEGLPEASAPPDAMVNAPFEARAGEPDATPAEPTPHESAAARVLRTIAPWTSSNIGSTEHNGSTD